MNLDKQHAALLVMDYQNDIVGMLGEHASALLERCRGVVDAARSANVPVLWITVGFRPGYPEIDPNHPTFAAAAKTGRFHLDTPGTAVADALGAKPDEPHFTKLRVGSFVGSGLEVVLRSKRISTLILAGISTSGVVLSTVRDAADRDFHLVVVEDCCADPDAEVHRVLTQKVFVKQGQVVAAKDVIAALT